MNAQDVVRQGIQNLLRHRGRTMLTVLGVIVGCCSVVVMISIGIGMRRATEAALAQMGDLTTITVESSDGGGKHKLDDAALEKIRVVENVTAVIPKLEADVGVKVYAGDGRRYAADYVTVVGESLEDARHEGYQLTEGDWDRLGSGEVLVGQSFAYSFRDTKRPEGHNTVDRYENYDWEAGTGNENAPEPYFDPTRETLTLVLSDGAEDTEGTEGGERREVSVELTVGGVMKEDWNRGYETSEGILMDLNTWQRLLDQYAKLTGTKRPSEKGYSRVLVKVDDIGNVAAAEQEIKALGFRTSSMESIRKPMEQEARQKQMMLGGMGAVSLFVAALGIANTMIMSITERIREIGVMKALGCFLRDVRRMFLLEAGCIGFIGGVIGIGLSYVISWIMNLVGAGGALSSEYMYEADAAASTLSVIPWWLAVFAVAFSVLVGVAAGYYPAEKAVRIPALEAIKHE